MTATSGAALGTIDVDDDVVDAFLDNLAPDASKKKPSDEGAEKVVADAGERPAQAEDKSARKPERKPEEPEAPAHPEEPEAKDGDEQEAQGEETEEHEDERKHVEDDGAFVKVKVGDEEHEVPVKDLTRLYGQEQALTKKSMEVAEQRKRSDAQIASNVAAHSALLERAQKRFEPFSKIDFNLAATQLSPEEYTNLRDAARAAYDDVQFLQNGLNQVVQQAEQRQSEHLVEQAKEALKVLGGPVDQGGIEGFNETYYDNLRQFAYDAGLKKEVVDNLVDPVAIKLLNDAMLFRRGTQNVVTKKVNNTPKQVIKTKQAPASSSKGADRSKADKAFKNLRASGDTDDAAEALLAGWMARDAELS